MWKTRGATLLPGAYGMPPGPRSWHGSGVMRRRPPGAGLPPSPARWAAPPSAPVPVLARPRIRWIVTAGILLRRGRGRQRQGTVAAALCCLSSRPRWTVALAVVAQASTDGRVDASFGRRGLRRTPDRPDDPLRAQVGNHGFALGPPWRWLPALAPGPPSGRWRTAVRQDRVSLRRCGTTPVIRSRRPPPPRSRPPPARPPTRPARAPPRSTH
jgi:hypothetical protein